MVSPASPLQRLVLSPCVGVCELRADGLCAGCGRSVAEIAAWSTMDDAARLRIMERLDARDDASSDTLRRVVAALHPLARVPAGPAWNLEEVVDLLPVAAPVPAAVLVGLVPRPEGLQVLLTRRTDALRQHAGQVSFPGGRIEPDDRDAATAAIRETGEEIGVAPASLAPLGWLDPLATVTGFTVLPLVATIAADYRARPDPREVDEVFEVPLDFLMAEANLRRVALQWQGRERTVLEFADRGQPRLRIWGATASILLNLRQRLERA